MGPFFPTRLQFLTGPKPVIAVVPGAQPSDYRMSNKANILKIELQNSCIQFSLQGCKQETCALTRTWKPSSCNSHTLSQKLQEKKAGLICKRFKTILKLNFIFLSLPHNGSLLQYTSAPVEEVPPCSVQQSTQ